MTTRSPGTSEGDTLPAVADVHGRYEPASRVRSADWLRVPSVSGLQCVQALKRAGFVVAAKLPGCVEMWREDLAIRVPLAERLDPEVLATILHRANIPVPRLLLLLDE